MPSPPKGPGHPSSPGPVAWLRNFVVVALCVVVGLGTGIALGSSATTAWDQERDAFDTGVGASQYSWSGLPYFTSVRDYRTYFRTHAQTCINQTTLAATRSCVVAFQADLARPGPANSVAKDLHTATRRFGDDALHAIP